MSKNFTEGHALIVGVGGRSDLPNTVDDAKGIATILTDPGRCAYPKDQVQLLTGAKARRNPVLEGLKSLAAVRSNSSVIIYFSGHGYRVGKGKKTEYYLMPYGYDVDRLDETAISGSEFASVLENIKAERLLVILDCCHAGGFDGTQAASSGAKSASKAVFTKAALPPQAQKMFAGREGRVIIASSKGSELSYAGQPYSAFTTALIASLCGEGTAKEDGYVRVMDLALYAREAVVKLTEDGQHPTMDFEKADNFAVAYYAGGVKKPKGLPAALKNSKVETKPGSGAFIVFDQSNWTVLGGVHNYHGNTTNIHGNLGFLQPGWQVRTVNQIQGANQETLRRDKGKRRR